MKEYNDKIWILITRVLSGEATPREREEFDLWLKEDEANRRFFEDLKTNWNQDPNENAAYNRFMFDAETGIKKFQHKLREERWAANQPSVYTDNFQTVSSWKIAASVLLIVTASIVFGTIHFWHPSTTTYSTTKMEQRIITLPDGSKVRLNKNSIISFTKGFSGSSRTVVLKGEAFFQIKHNANKPFVIRVGNAVVRDIGTAFNINQSRDGKIVVAVKNGIASFRNKDTDSEEASILKKNQIGILEHDGISTIKQSNVKNYLSWINGHLEFDKMRFDHVITQLNNIYGIHSQLADSSLQKLKLTAFTDDTTLNEVLHMIALSLNITYKKNGSSVVWMKKNHPKLKSAQKI